VRSVSVSPNFRGSPTFLLSFPHQYAGGSFFGGVILAVNGQLRGELPPTSGLKSAQGYTAEYIDGSTENVSLN